MRERIEYKTKILPARTGAEQRYKLRHRPRRSLAFDLLAMEGESQPFDAILWNRQGQLFGVPWWPEIVAYSGTLAAGTTTISVDTTNRLFRLAPMVMVWTSASTCEVQSVESVSDNLIACAPLSAEYVNPLVVPVFPGRLEPSQEVERLTSRIANAAVEFSCEVSIGDARPSPASMTQVYGYDVLEVEPNWNSPRSRSRRILSTFDNGVGPIVVRDRGGVSFQGQDFAWFLSGRSEIQALRDFIDRRAGALSPFWVRTGREDLTVAQQTTAGSTGILVKACGYTTRMFPDSARRYLAIQNPSGGWIYRKVTSSSAAGATETLGLDSTVGAVLPVGTSVSFLTLCRLEDDSTEIEWSNVVLAQATTKLTELPKEVPA